MQTTLDLETAFVQATLDALQRDCKLGDAIALAYGKCEAPAGVIDLIFPLLTRKLRIDYVLMCSLEPSPRTLLRLLRLCEARLAQLDTWTSASIEAAAQGVAEALNLDRERVQRLLKCCILFSDSPLDLVDSIAFLGRPDTLSRLSAAASNIELSHLIN
jgi:hypothetical protein